MILVKNVENNKKINMKEKICKFLCELTNGILCLRLCCENGKCCKCK